MFATGIENSIPTIQGGTLSIDAFGKCRHYTKRLSRYFFPLVGSCPKDG
jgi:hypothetical protein